MEDEIRASKNIKLYYIGLFALTGIGVCLFSLVSGKSYEETLRNTIVSFIISGTVLFMMMDAHNKGKQGFSYDNFYHRNRFIAVYGILILLSCLLSLVPNQFWPYMSLFVILGLFSNFEIGLVSGMGFVAISVMLEEHGSYAEFLMYAIAGIVALALLKELNEQTEVGFPVAISLLIQAVLLMAFDVLFQNRSLSINIMIMPVLNIMLNLVILLVSLNVFGVYILRRTNDRYMEINDAEYTLLTNLKEKNKDEYFRAIHTAYIADRIAHGLGLNDRAVKCCSYYHRIGVPEGKTAWNDIKNVYFDNHFPDEAIEFLHDYIEPAAGKVKSKEALALNLSETLIASIMYLIKKDKDVKINYDQLIDKILETKEKEGELNNYDVTFSELESMRKILKKEKLYYDFLR